MKQAAFGIFDLTILLPREMKEEKDFPSSGDHLPSKEITPLFAMKREFYSCLPQKDPPEVPPCQGGTDSCWRMFSPCVWSSFTCCLTGSQNDQLCILGNAENARTPRVATRRGHRTSPLDRVKAVAGRKLRVCHIPSTAAGPTRQSQRSFSLAFFALLAVPF